MHKNALFFEKSRKIAAALGAPLPNPRWPPAVRGSVPDPELFIPSHVALIFSRAFVA